ncbi:MAG: hypothetical protein JEY97_03830 [Bacteroidales bacterium]|nr:hypothetical protein [Bacteroidales bacterium]
MKQLSLIIIITFLFLFSNAQQSIDNKDFGKIVRETEKRYKNKDKGKGTGYKQFKRWENFVEYRLDKDGKRLNNSAMSFIAYENLKRKGGVISGQTDSGSWAELGPDTWTNNPDPYPETDQGGWNPGNGRINEVAFHPTNPDIIYAGSAGGGLWKTTDGGITWSCMTDDLINLAISGIVVSHSDPNTVYILTGDGDSDDLVSIGVLKSTDGGITWNQTGLTFDRDDVVFGTELKMDPANSNNIIATSSDGIYYTNNAGVTWPKVESGEFYDVEFNPVDNDTVFASTENSIFRSSDGGYTWVSLRNFSGNMTERTRIELAVTPVNSHIVYAVLGDKDNFRGVFFSENGGQNWLSYYQPFHPNILSSNVFGFGNSTQASYDLAIEVSPTDENVVFVGGINIWKSDYRGHQWSAITQWRDDWDTLAYVHADIHELIFNGNDLYSGCDGGLFKSTDMGTSWSDISFGLGIMQPHKIGITTSNTNLVYMGTQDNGVNKYSGSTNVEHVRGADGLECIIMPDNPDHIFTSRQNGIIEVSNDGGVTFDAIITNTHNKLFNNPLLLRPVSNDRLISAKAGEILIFYLDGSFDFNKVIPMNDLQFVKAMDISPTNENLMLAASRGNIEPFSVDDLWITTTLFTGQNTWTNIGGGLPLDIYSITDVVIDPTNETHFVVTLGGYDDGNKVFESWNSGDNWVNVSYNLENIPVSCIALDPEVPNSMFIGTDIGVFNRENGEEYWSYFSTGLPAVMVHELEINSKDNLIYAATYGRGLWVSTFGSDCPVSYHLTNQTDPSIPGFTGIQVYTAQDSIISTRHIVGGAGTDVYYQAGEFIDLRPGFVAEQGNKLNVQIGECGIDR